MITIPCVILAGGRSRRMGQDKSRLPFGGFSTLIEYQFRRLKEIFETVVVSVKTAEGLPFRKGILEDIDQEQTPLNGVATAFEVLKSDKIFVIPVDYPMVGEEEVDVIISASLNANGPTLACSSARHHYLLGVYGKEAVMKMKSLIPDHGYKMEHLLSHLTVQYVTFDDSSRFMNLNRLEEYRQACLEFERCG